jgi:hypothetical protein
MTQASVTHTFRSLLQQEALLQEKRIDLVDKNDTEMKVQTWKSVLAASIDYSLSQVKRER